MIGKTGRKTKHSTKIDESRLPSSNFRLETDLVGPRANFLGGTFSSSSLKKNGWKNVPKENWLEHLDETLRQHGVNRCDEGAKFLGRVFFFFLGGGLVGWFLVGGGWGGFGIRYTFFFLAKISGEHMNAKTSSDGKMLAVQDIFSQVHSSKSVWSLDQTLRLLASIWSPHSNGWICFAGIGQGPPRLGMACFFFLLEKNHELHDPWK